MPKQDSITVYPVAGLYVLGVPAVPTTTTPEEAESLVATGAFTHDPPAADEPIAAGRAASKTED